jgi:hypothetical protein
VALLAASTVVSGCGQAEQVMRKLDVKSAAAWIEDAPAVRATISLDAQPDALAALVREHGGDSGVTKRLLDDPALLQAVANARVVVVGAPGGTALTAATVQVGETDLAELVLGGRDVLARIDAARLAAYLPGGGPLAGKDPAGLALLLDLAAPGTGDVVRGRWVAADTQAAAQWAGPRLGAVLVGGEQAMPAVARAFETVVRRATIREDPADPAHTTMTITGDDLRAVLGSKAPAKLPATLTFDAYTTDGRLDRLSVDLGQFADGAKATGSGGPGAGPVRLTVRLEQAQPVRAPSGPRRLDLAGLPTLTKLLGLVQRLPEPTAGGTRP